MKFLGKQKGSKKERKKREDEFDQVTKVLGDKKVSVVEGVGVNWSRERQKIKENERERERKKHSERERY